VMELANIVAQKRRLYSNITIITKKASGIVPQQRAINLNGLGERSQVILARLLSGERYPFGPPKCVYGEIVNAVPDRGCSFITFNKELDVAGTSRRTFYMKRRKHDFGFL
jgi:hypothetical protein